MLFKNWLVVSFKRTTGEQLHRQVGSRLLHSVELLPGLGLRADVNSSKVGCLLAFLSKVMVQLQPADWFTLASR